ncbi:uncharacterized protein LOC125218032 [Salvia hispanica]|uniref:uncharacterized protein LOC125218032 n=1 Tax=Salvia hispanica TaxID=49212 RepID=UPI002009A805|nr:uncharacterized protein LOC125218032 [Salvia hispanica]
MASQHLKNFLTSCTLWKTLVVIGLFLNLIVTTQKPHQLLVSVPAPPRPQAANDHRTNLSHIAFGMMGSVPTWPHRRGYLEAWWRPNKTRGYVILDRAPPPELLPWPRTAPPYKIVDNISELFRETKPRFELMPRMVHGLVELLREEREGVRWVVMGDDDTVVFVENVVDVLAELDHRKYYYLGWHSESVISNFWYSFDQAFGGGGIVMSYPLAAALVRDMDRCLIRYAGGWSADWISMACIADVGVSLTPHKGIHQVDLHGDFSGYLSAHPQTPLMTFHHFDAMDPIFPSMDRMQSTRHLMKAADADQSRLLQQTICYHKKTNWSISVSWGYSAQIYERIMPRSYLQLPIETFTPWASGKEHPFYMFNTRPQSNDSCEKPHFFFLQSVSKTASPHHIVTTYKRARPRGLPPCSSAGNHPADTITKIKVISPTKKRLQIDRCECCDIVRVNGGKMEVGLRECKIDEIIA